MENPSLVRDLLEWLDAAPRRYPEVMNAWRTSCPRLTIWEDAVDARFVAVRGQQVTVTATGAAFLRATRDGSAAIAHRGQSAIS